MNYRIIYKDELYHHGVKGMKWGVRRTPEQLGHRGSIQSKNVEVSSKSTHSRETELRQKKMREELSKSDWSQGQNLIRNSLDDDDIETINKFLDRADKTTNQKKLHRIYSESMNAFVDIAEKMLGEGADDLVDFAIESMMDTPETWYRSERQRRAAKK